MYAIGLWYRYWRRVWRIRWYLWRKSRRAVKRMPQRNQALLELTQEIVDAKEEAFTMNVAMRNAAITKPAKPLVRKVKLCPHPECPQCGEDAFINYGAVKNGMWKGHHCTQCGYEWSWPVEYIDV